MVESMPEEDLLDVMEGHLRERLEAEAATMLQMSGRCWLSRRWCDRLRAEWVEQAALEEAVWNLAAEPAAEFYPCVAMRVLVLKSGLQVPSTPEDPLGVDDDACYFE